MGCIPGKENEVDGEFGGQIGNCQEKEDCLSKTQSNRPSLIIKREIVDEVGGKNSINFENVLWKDEIKTMIQIFKIDSLFIDIEKKISDVKEREEMTVFLESEKEDYNLGMKIKITKDMKLGSIHEYYNTNKLPFHPEDFIYFNLFQDGEIRKKIDKKCKIFQILAVLIKNDIIYFLIHSLIDGYLMLKGKETFYIKAVKKIQDPVSGKLRYFEVNKSVEHFTLPEKEDYTRIDIIENVGVYEYLEESKGFVSEYYCKVIPQTNVGVAFLKPFLNKYNKEYIKNSVECLKSLKEKKDGSDNWDKIIKEFGK